MSLRRGLLVKYVAYFATLVSVALIASSLLDMYFSYREEPSDCSVSCSRRGRVVRRCRSSGSSRRSSGTSDGSTLPLIDMLAANKEEQRFELSKLLRQVPAIAEATLLAPDGRELAYVSRLGLDAEGSGRDWTTDPAVVAARTGGTHFGRVHFRKETEPYLTIAVAGRSRAGPIVVAEVNLKFIWDVVSRIEVGTAGRAYVVDSEGYLIAHPDISLVLQKTDLSGLPQVRAARTDPSVKPAISMVADDRLGRLGSDFLRADPGARLVRFRRAARGRSVCAALCDAVANRIPADRRSGAGARRERAARTPRGTADPRPAERRGRDWRGPARSPHRHRIGDEFEALAGEFNRMAAQLQESYAGLEAKVEERTRDLAVANQHKSEFLAAMSHELRTPLNAIIGFSDVLKRRMYGELNPKQAKYVEVINTSGKHLLSLINDILDLSKVEAGKMELDVSPFNLPDAVDDALALIRGRADSKSIAVDVKLDPRLDIAVADERKFRQILLNLLSNAVKFTPDRGSIVVSGKRLPDAIEVSVSDSGIGIAPEDHAAVFEEFTQINGVQRPEGTGLGLALAKKLVELHGGAIRVESALGQGAKFTFSLPQPEHA